jgi:hypothetical protein
MRRWWRKCSIASSMLANRWLAPLADGSGRGAYRRIRRLGG